MTSHSMPSIMTPLILSTFAQQCQSMDQICFVDWIPFKCLWLPSVLIINTYMILPYFGGVDEKSKFLIVYTIYFEL